MNAKRPAAQELTSSERWKATEQRVRALERSTSRDDSHRRIVRVALNAPPTDELYLGEMSNAPIVYAEDGVDAVQWSDGSWEPIPDAE